MKCDCCQDDVEVLHTLTDRKNKLRLDVCKDCIDYAFESVKVPTKKGKESVYKN